MRLILPLGSEGVPYRSPTVLHFFVLILYIIVAALHGHRNYFAGSTLISILQGCNLLTNHTHM